MVQWLDRFGRNPKEILRRIWELQEAGVDVQASDEDFREELVLLVKAGMAGAESRRIGERVRAAIITAVSNGSRFGARPFGYQPVTERDGSVHYEQVEHEARAIREMYRLAVDENLGFKAIADRMHDLGVVTVTGKPFLANGIRRILRNPATAGTFVWGRKTTGGRPLHQSSGCRMRGRCRGS